MRELVGGKNTIRQMASVLKKLQKATFTFFTFSPQIRNSTRDFQLKAVLVGYGQYRHR